MVEVQLARSASEKMTLWQLRKVYGQLSLLQEHSSDLSCPCELTTEHEFCIPKHCVHLQSLAEESVAMVKGDLAEVLSGIAGAANDLRRAYEEAREAGKEPPYEVITQFAREGRKRLEPYIWKYKMELAQLAIPEEKQPRWCFPVKEVERSLGRVSRELGILQSKTKHLRERLDMPIQICRGQAEMFQILDPWGSRCRDPLTGRWTSKEDCPEIPTDPYTIEGKELTWAISPVGIRRYDFVYKVVEAKSLIPSHDPMTFEPTPAFPQELQPRLRERAAPRVQVERIAATLDPGLLLEDYHATDRGAPIVGRDMVVESGNGRAMAIIRASTEHPEVYAEYKGALLVIAPRYGLDPKAIEKMKVPVLVRERVTEVVRTEFVSEANATSSISRSTVEIARTDADNVTTEMLYELSVLNGETLEDALRAVRNQGFVNRFLIKLPSEEQAGLLDAEGRVNQDGIRRIGTAVFVKAFETADTGLVLAERWFESTEPDVKNVFNGIARALGPLARAEALVAANQRQPELTIAEDLTEAIGVYSKVRKLQMRVEDYLAQMPMFEQELNDFQEKIMVALHDRRRSPKRIGELLSHYANLVIDSPHPDQAVLIEVEAPSKEMFWDEAMRRTEREAEPAPVLFQNWCNGKANCATLYKKGGELKMSDPLLAEIASKVCSTGVCFAEPKKKSRLPICTSKQVAARERCIIKLKPRQKAGEIRSAYAVCTAAVSCRPGRKGEK